VGVRVRIAGKKLSNETINLMQLSEWTDMYCAKAYHLGTFALLAVEGFCNFGVITNYN
jgi:hypothetical protein